MSRLYTELLQLNYNNKKQSDLKMCLELEYPFLWMTNKHMKRCSILLRKCKSKHSEIPPHIHEDVKVKSLSRVRLFCDPVDYSPPGSSVHGILHSVQFSSVTPSCLTLCDPMDSSMSGFPVHHQLPELAQTHVHWLSDAIQPSHPVVPFSCLQSFPASGSFQMSQFFSSGGQSIGASASASALPMNS